MFPYIPDSNHDDFAALWKHYESEFESKFPAVDLSVSTATSGSYYNAADVAGWLNDGTYDVVEIDMVMLGDVLATGAIQPFWDPGIASRFFAPSVESVQIDAKYWGIPHLMCTYYLLSRSSEVAGATSFDAQYQALKALPGTQKFAADLGAGWDTTAMYVESYYQQDMGAPAGAVANPVVVNVLGNLHDYATLCVQAGGANPCTDGTYTKQYNQPAIDFALGKTASSVGYSERLWVVLTQDGVVDPDKIQPSALLMGPQNFQLVFTDAFVVSAKCVDDCLDAALEWASYATSKDALGYMLASEDAGANAVPRYLLPANLEAAQYGKLASDPYYPLFLDKLVHTSPLPNRKVPEYKDANEAEIAKVVANGP